MNARAYFIQCPACAAQGKDTRKNNLAVYDDDGHKHCFACGYHEAGEPMKRLENLKDNLSQIDKHIMAPSGAGDLYWPTDFTTTLPGYVKNWLNSYHITDWEIEKYKIGYSYKQELLIYPVFDEHNNLILWTGRNFRLNSHGPKYVIFGLKADIVHIIGKKGKDLVVVEDFVSAIKLARTYQAMPLFGATLPPVVLKTLSERFETVGIWLDPDKRVEGIKMALRTSQFVPAYSVYSKEDPKFYYSEEISLYVEEASRDMLIPGQETPSKLQPKSKPEDTTSGGNVNVLKHGDRYETYSEWTTRLSFVLDRVEHMNMYNEYYWLAIIKDRNFKILPLSAETFDEWVSRTDNGDKTVYNRCNRLLDRKFISRDDGVHIWVDENSLEYKQKLSRINNSLDKHN